MKQLLSAARTLAVIAIALIASVQIAMATTRTCPSLEIAAVEDPGERTIAGPDGQIVRVAKTPLLSMSDFSGANVTLTEGQIVLNVNLSHAGGERIQAYTKDHVGAFLAFVVNGQAIKVARILDPIVGDGILVGPLDKSQADELAETINTHAASCGAG